MPLQAVLGVIWEARLRQAAPAGRCAGGGGCGARPSRRHFGSVNVWQVPLVVWRGPCHLCQGQKSRQGAWLMGEASKVGTRCASSREG